MSRLRGFAAAGLPILKRKPAFATQVNQTPGLFTAGPFIFVIAIASLVGLQGHSIPLPPHKPDMGALMLDQGVSVSSYIPTGALDAGPYRSPLEGTQMDLYREIFRLQDMGAFDQADKRIHQLKDKSLLGHVRAQRYLHADYKAGFEELKDWLSNYADLPEAERISRLANRRVPEGGATLAKVTYSAPSIETMDEPGMTAKTYVPDLVRTKEQDGAVAALVKSIRRHVQKYEPSAALALLNEDPSSVYLDTVEKDRMLATIAAGYLYAGKMDEAANLSARALNRSGAFAPQAGWINGLVQWRFKNYKEAAKSFENTAISPFASGWMVSAASYWAGRAEAKAGSDRAAQKWMKRAADYPKTFYGMMAAASLGKSTALDWAAPELARAQEKEILGTPAGQRAEKLLAAGQVTLAEDEIRALYVRGDNARKKALLAFAYDRKLPGLSMKLAHSVSGNPDSALYPAMPWAPTKGYRIDRALLHAIIRQESHFNASAENRWSGATGLMQLMPNTAYHVAGEDKFNDYEGKALLKTPEVSLDLGQDYVEELLNNGTVGQDLLSLAIAYNAGPGNLARWKAERADVSDPLYFLETIPYAETRTYTKRVMANYWIYRARFDQTDDSLLALANGKWARYAALDKDAVKFASAE